MRLQPSKATDRPRPPKWPANSRPGERDWRSSPVQVELGPYRLRDMDYFHYRDRVLYCEDVPVTELARAYGTPLFVYSKRTVLHHLAELRRAFAAVDPLICYSIKTNANLNLCRLL